MSNRSDLLEAALENFPEGVALLGEDGQVRFWNRAAAAITGFASVELVSRAVPEELKALLDTSGVHAENDGPPTHATRAHARHKLGHDVAAMARPLVLRDGTGCRIGTAVIFQRAESPAEFHLESFHAPPRRPTGNGEDTQSSLQASISHLTERLDTLFGEFLLGGATFSVLSVAVDQSHELRRTHGAGACEAMLARIEHTLTHSLRSAESMGRWGNDEFLIVCPNRVPDQVPEQAQDGHDRAQDLTHDRAHDRTHDQGQDHALIAHAQALAAHAQALAELARTADFRWWGDRVPLTVSVGIAQAETGSLASLLERARTAMAASRRAGGDRITAAPASTRRLASEEQACSQS